MNKIPREVYSYLSSVQGVQLEDQWAFIDTIDGTYIYYSFPQDVSVYDDFDKIGFTSYQKPINASHDSFQLFFVDSNENRNPLEILNDLYQKSSTEVMVDSQVISNIYHKMEQKYQSLLQYYYSLQNQIEEMYYPRRNYYQLLIHMSSIYRLLHLGNHYLEEWFSMKEDVYREVFTIHNLSSHNFHDGVLDVSSAKKDLFIFELANYYQKHYQDDGILDDIQDFMNRFSMSKNEIYLFFALISVVWELNEDTIEELSSFFQYVHQTYDFLLEKYQKDEERKEQMLEEKKEYI